jgi:DNA-binding NarL/FixJ family response regulator
MGRPRKTPEHRLQAVPMQTQVDLQVAWQKWSRSRAQADRDLDALKAEVAAALGEDGVSVRDVAAVLSLSPSTVQELVRPHRAARAARAV